MRTDFTPYRCRWRLPGIVLKLAILAGLTAHALEARADTPVTLRQSFAGNINITGTAGTLRTASDTTNSCSVTNSGSMQLMGIPAGSTIVTAYLYWAGSGGQAGEAAADFNVTFDGTPVTADRTYTASYNNGGNILNFFGGVKDVTSLVTGNRTYTFANLAVQSTNVTGGGSYCSSAAVLSAFALVVIYSNPAETLHVVNVWEGLQTYRGSSIALIPTNFRVPATGIDGRHLVLTWEGDSANSASLNGYNENLSFCAPAPCTGAALTDAYNPVNNQFNSTVDIPPSGPFSSTRWGVDLDMYDISSRLHAGDASAQAVYSSGGDLVLLANQTMSISNTGVADLSLSKVHNGSSFTAGGNGTYTLSVLNNGPSTATNTITVTDTLPAGLTYVSAAGTGWSCGAAGQTVTCTRPGPLASGATAPAITLTAAVSASAPATLTNTANASSTDFDNVSGNNSSTDIVSVLQPPIITLTKSVNTPTAAPGSGLIYTIYYRNLGGSSASNLVINDSIPLFTTYTPNSIKIGSAASTYATATALTDAADADAGQLSGGAVTFTISTLAPNDGVANSGSDEGKAYFQVVIN